MGKPIEFLEIPDGWIKSCGLEDEKGQPGSLPGRAEYIVDVPRDDDYYLFLRAKWHDSCGNSVYLQLNGADWFTIEDTEGEVDKTTYKWAWHALRDGSAPRAIPLKKGPNRLVLAPKEDGPMLDKILIGTDATQPAPETMDP
ncbi:MAG: hypothetical protein M5U26_07230 [Planctomycetota bacterium]|nr:hypothetical protein [Planctomycetota bacterium]